MTRFEQGQQERLAPWTAAAREFAERSDDIAREAQLLAALAEIIKQPGFEYADDETYRKYADELEQHCRALSAAARD